MGGMPAVAGAITAGRRNVSILPEKEGGAENESFCQPCLRRSGRGKDFSPAVGCNAMAARLSCNHVPENPAGFGFAAMRVR